MIDAISLYAQEFMTYSLMYSKLDFLDSPLISALSCIFFICNFERFHFRKDASEWTQSISGWLALRSAWKAYYE